MRIIAGKMGGVNLHVPFNKGTRPLKDLARESIFNLIVHSKKISFNLEKSKVLDLYAGTGSFGLECISRKAGNVTFVEKEYNAIKILEKNIDKLKVENLTEILQKDVINFIKKTNKINPKFDLIFCDPPFKENIEELIKIIFNKNFLKRSGIIVFHRNKKTKDKIPDYLKIIDERIYGISKIIFARFLT